MMYTQHVMICELQTTRSPCLLLHLYQNTRRHTQEDGCLQRIYEWNDGATRNSIHAAHLTPDNRLLFPCEPRNEAFRFYKMRGISRVAERRLVTQAAFSVPWSLLSLHVCAITQSSMLALHHNGMRCTQRDCSINITVIIKKCLM
jgi:hypothetical protein